MNEALAARAQQIAAAVMQVGPTSPAWPAMRARIATSSGLSEPMVDWAIETSSAAWQTKPLLELHAQAMRHSSAWQAVVTRHAVVWLAGNVFTATLPALFVPLLFGVSVTARVSSRDDAYAELLAAAWQRSATPHSPALQLVRLAHDDAPAARRLLSSADAVAVYGSDATLAQLRQWAPPTTRLLEHGHGLGAAWIPAAALATPEAASRVAHQLALDVAAYDQRGCLSPQAVWVEEGGHVTAQDFAILLAEDGLRRWQNTLPRGPVPDAIAGQLQHWRAAAAVRGQLSMGEDYAVSFEGDHPPRTSPGWRHVVVHQAPNVAACITALQPWLPHLKTLGVAGDEVQHAAVNRALPNHWAGRIALLGRMQCPPLDGLADGVPVWQGLVEYRSVIRSRRQD